MPPERKTLMDIWSGGKFKTSSDLPSVNFSCSTLVMERLFLISNFPKILFVFSASILSIFSPIIGIVSPGFCFFKRFIKVSTFW